MGRRDAVQLTLELVAEWRRLGAEVTFEPGWETRGNGLSANYEGGNVHHTGFGSSEANPFPAKKTLIGGRPDLNGPLSNTAGPYCPPDRPRIHVIAAHPANHAGASGGRGTAPMPVTSLFNPRSYGHEIDYGGNVPMSLGQLRAALIWTRGLTNVLRRSTEYVRAHAETSVTGKWDPGYAPGRSIDMAAFRRDASQITPVEDDMTPEQAKLLGDIGALLGTHLAPALGRIDSRVGDIHSKVIDSRLGTEGRPGPDEDDLYGHILSIRGALAKLASGGVDVKALAAEIVASMDVKGEVQDALREGTGASA